MALITIRNFALKHSVNLNNLRTKVYTSNLTGTPSFIIRKYGGRKTVALYEESDLIPFLKNKRPGRDIGAPWKTDVIEVEPQQEDVNFLKFKQQRYADLIISGLSVYG